MEGYKLRVIMDHVLRQGRLPTDQWGETLSPDDLLVWFGLKGVLSDDEERIIKKEFASLGEAEAFADRMRVQAI